MIFANAINQYLFLFVVSLLIIYILYWLARKQNLKLFTSNKLLSQMVFSTRPIIRHIKLAFYLISLSFIILAIMRPKWDKQSVKLREHGIEIIFILDNSLSMLAEDVDLNDNKRNRFHIAKKTIEQLINLSANNKYGLILVAGLAQVECPIILNSNLLRNLYLKNAQIAPNFHQGTKLASAIDLAITLFTPAQYIPKVIFLVSDGEDHNSNLKQSLKKARENNIVIHTLGIGNIKGAPIPLPNPYNANARKFKLNWKNEIVLTSLQENVLQKIAKNTNGNYYGFSSKKSLTQFYAKIKSPNNDIYSDKYIYVPKDQFQIFILAATFFFILGLFLPENKKHWQTLFRIKHSISLFLILFITMAFTNYNNKGQKLYNNKNYQQAITEFNNAINEAPNNPLLYLFRGNSYYRLKEFNNAEQDYLKGLQQAQDPKIKSLFSYNLGKTAVKNKQYQQALEWYKKSLQADPDHYNARHNYYLLKKKLQKQIKKSFQSSPKNNNKSPQSDQQKQSNGKQAQQNDQNKSGPNKQNNDNEQKSDPLNKKLEQLYNRDKLNRSELHYNYNSNQPYSYNEKDW